MKSSSLIPFVSLLPAAAASHNIAATFNTLLHYDPEAITNPNFVDDVLNATTLALAAAVKAFDQDPPQGGSLTWENLYGHADATLGQLGWIRQSSSSSSFQESTSCTNLEQAIASAYEGPEAIALRELLVNRQVLGSRNEAVNDVLFSFLNHRSCLFDGETACVKDEDDSLRVVCLLQGSTSQDLSMVVNTMYLQDSSVKSTSVITWTLNPSVYDQSPNGCGPQD